MDEERMTKKNLQPNEDEQERLHFLRIVSAFNNYRTHALQRVAGTENYLNSLPPKHQTLLKDYRTHLNEIKVCIESNNHIIQQITKDVAFMFQNVEAPEPIPSSSHDQPLNPQCPTLLSSSNDQPLDPQCPTLLSSSNDQPLDPQCPTLLSSSNDQPLDPQCPILLSSSNDQSLDPQCPTLLSSSNDQSLDPQCPTLLLSSNDQPLDPQCSTLLSSSNDQSLDPQCPTLLSSSNDQPLDPQCPTQLSTHAVCTHVQASFSLRGRGRRGRCMAWDGHPDGRSDGSHVIRIVQLRNANPVPGAADVEKVQATLKQFVRDWSEDGAAERRACYTPIIEEIVAHFPPNQCNPPGVRVLVPGAGLGRLAYEIAQRGYTCQGNEFSLFMLFASNFVLNKCRGKNIYKVYPWVHQFVNNLMGAHQIAAVSFPDVNPADLPPESQFSMAAGDFLEVYTERDEWDCVATCFFIDCANNIVAFIETIYNILKPGGIWVNLGPLLYHFSDVPDENSIEPSYDIVRDIILKMGFEIEREERSVPTSYAQNPSSMLQYEYKSVFFVCRKVDNSEDGVDGTEGEEVDEKGR